MLKQLRAQRAKIIGDLRAMIAAAEGEDRDFSAEELAIFDAAKIQKDSLDNRIGRLESQDGMEAALDASRGAAAATPQLAAVRRGPEAKKDFQSFGEFLAAVRFRPNDSRLTYVERTSAAGEDEAGDLRAELRTDDGPSGGFMLPPQFRSTLLQLKPQDAVVRPRATVLDPGTPPDGPLTIPALDQSGAAPGNVFGGVQVRWIEEGAEKPPTDLKLRDITLTPHEVAGTLTVTDKLLRNWPAASPLIEKLFRGAIGQVEDLAFTFGNGVGKPLGYLKSSSVYRVPRAQAGKISYLDLIAAEARAWGENWSWIYSLSVLPQLRQLQNPQGQYIWSPSAREEEPDMLLGRPAIQSNRNAILGQPGDICIADLSQYLIKDGTGPFVATSEHVLFTSNKTVIKTYWNVDGAPWLTSPIVLENGYTVSPFVMIDVPAV